MLRRHLRFVAGLAIVAVVLVLGLLRASPAWPGPPLPPGATALVLATEPAHLAPTLGCPMALLAPARLAVVGDELVLVPESGDDPLDVVWPAGWAAWRRAGVAELVSHDGTVIGREGETIQGFSGGNLTDGRFHVCVIGG